MKTPITYYGGKISMLKDILPLIPPHKIYVEPFVGGGAVFWAKEKSEVEIINDNSGQVTNFYEVLKTKFTKLKKLVDATLHNRLTYKYALMIYKLPMLFTNIQRAWAFWVTTNQGFSGIIGSWSYNNGGKTKTFHNKKQRFTKELSERIDTVQIECNDALKVITSRDTPDTFFYIDPPYIGADQGHYSGYTEDDFIALLEVLSNIKGTFLLSTYYSDVLKNYAIQNKWNTTYLPKPLTASMAKGKRKMKTEVLTYNYGLNQLHLR